MRGEFREFINQPSYFLNPKFQAFSHFLRLCSPVCVGPGWKNAEDRLFHDAAHIIAYHQLRLVTKSVQSVTAQLHSYTEMTGNSIILNIVERMVVSHLP